VRVQASREERDRQWQMRPLYGHRDRAGTKPTT
jgi:hypothetical protein